MKTARQVLRNPSCRWHVQKTHGASRRARQRMLLLTRRAEDKRHSELQSLCPRAAGCYASSHPFESTLLHATSQEGSPDQNHIYRADENQVIGDLPTSAWKCGDGAARFRVHEWSRGDGSYSDWRTLEQTLHVNACK